MALSADTLRDYELGNLNNLPVKTATTIYQGAAVGLDAGYAVGLVAGQKFAGFATAKVVNTGASGAESVAVRESGKIVLLVTGVTGVADKGKPVYASDDGTFTLTAGSNSHIGRVDRHISSTKCIVAFDAQRAGGGNLTALTDSSGGTASTTVPVIGGSYVQADIANAFATLTAAINTIAKQS